MRYFAIFALIISTCPLSAQERPGAVTIFPPIMREMARDTAATRPWAELTMTPHPVPAARHPAPAALQTELVARRYAEPVAAAVTGALD